MHCKFIAMLAITIKIIQLSSKYMSKLYLDPTGNAWAWTKQLTWIVCIVQTQTHILLTFHIFKTNFYRFYRFNLKWLRNAHTKVQLNIVNIDTTSVCTVYSWSWPVNYHCACQASKVIVDEDLILSFILVFSPPLEITLRSQIFLLAEKGNQQYWVQAQSFRLSKALPAWIVKRKGNFLFKRFTWPKYFHMDISF